MKQVKINEQEYYGSQISINNYYIKYINDCKNQKRYKRVKIVNENPYISICIPALN